MKKIEAILFDVDGVVIQPPKMFSQQYQKKFHAPSDAYLKEFFTGIFVECTLGNADLKEVMQTRISDWKWKGTVDEFLNLWFVLENYPEKILLSKIQEIRKKGVLCYLATNQEKYRVGYLKDEMSFGTLFDGIYTSSDIGYRKPDPEFYTYILRDIGISPESVIYLDDEEKNVESARALGILGRHYRGIQDVLNIVEY